MQWVADANYKLAEGEKDVDGTILKHSSGPGGVDSSGNRFGVGDFIRFNADGTRTVVSNPTPDDAAQIARITGTEVQATGQEILETAAVTLNSAIATWNENNCFEALPVQHTDVGRLIGNLLSIATAGAETYVGLNMIAVGGAEAGLTLSACATGAGCAIPAVGVVVAVSGAVVTTHGVFTIGNTLYNAIIKGQPTGGGSQSGSSPDPPSGQTSAGRPTNEYGRPLGPSGKEVIHQVDKGTKKDAKDAARNAGNGAPVKHPSPKKGGPHYHPTKNGKKKPDGTHYNY